MGSARGKREPGRKAPVTMKHWGMLSAIASQWRRSSPDELTRESDRHSGLRVCSATVRKALRQASVQRMRPHAQACRTRGAAWRGAGSRGFRVGYTAPHRRTQGASGMNTNLTDAEWALVADRFERRDGRGAPPRPTTGGWILNACLYVVRTGCAWRLLPKTLRPGARYTRPCTAGCTRAPSRPCTNGCVNSGASASVAPPSPPPPASTRRAPQYRAGRQHGLRCRQEGHGPQASLCGRYAGSAAGRDRHHRPACITAMPPPLWWPRPVPRSPA